ncbi:MAG: ATP phosphoribosyltransferase regulatory subunit, partial [Oscillospiraceae bacterium]
MPIARLSATRLKGYTLPLRLYYNQSVYIVNPALSGRSDEVAQIGIELIGSKNKRTDLEVIVTALEALQSCGLKDFRLEIGHIGFFNTLIAQLHISDSEKDEIRMLIETKNYPSLNDQLDQLENKEVANALKQLPALFGGEEVFEKAAALYDSETLRETTRYLKSIYTALSKSGLDDKISLDLGIVTRNDYYTGIVFKGYVRGLGTKVLVGGRYDSLLSDYGVDLPAIGFGINVDAVAGAIKNDDDAPPVADVLLFAEEGYEVETLLRMNELTKSGLVAEFSVFESFEKTKKYAIQKGIPKIYVIREETLEVSL